MLVLSRKRGEKVLVPQCELTVTVLAVQGHTVRLGITAPPEIAVHREELWREIQSEENPGVADAKPSNDLVDAFAAELSGAAYQIALRHGLADSWADVEQGLWHALAATVEKAGRKFSRPVPKISIAACEAAPARLPR